MKRWAIFWLGLSEVRFERSWIAVTVLMFVVPLAGYHIAPVEEDPGVGAQTRTQLVWIAAWLFSIFWVNWRAAALSAVQSTRNHRTWWKSVGLSDSRYFWQVSMVPLTLNVMIFGGAALIATLFGRGEMPTHEAGAVNAQAFILASIAQACVVLVIVGMGNRMDATAAFSIGWAFDLYGLYAMSWIDRLRAGNQSRTVTAIADMLWSISPHLHFADLLTRLTFGWGAIDGPTFCRVGLYLVLVAAGGAVAGRIMFSFRR